MTAVTNAILGYCQPQLGAQEIFVLFVLVHANSSKVTKIRDIIKQLNGFTTLQIEKADQTS